jgi:hypothetical protein
VLRLAVEDFRTLKSLLFIVCHFRKLKIKN